MFYFFKFSLVCEVLLFVSVIVECFNVSPVPNSEFTVDFNEKSLFGMSVSLDVSQVFIGAPKYAGFASQYNTTGAVFSCNIKNEKCENFQLDFGDIRGKTKDHQLLGFSADIMPNQKYVACAPQYKTVANDYYLHGACYWGNPSNSMDSKMIYALSDQNLQSIKLDPRYPEQTYYYQLGEQGFSVHMVDSEEVIMGAPGILNWRGSVIRNKKNVNEGIINRQRRQVVYDYDYLTNVVNPRGAKIANDSYLGYSISSGHFDSNNPNKVLYVAGAPKGNELSGIVYLFDFVQTQQGETTMNVLHEFKSKEFGEYFGYSLLVEDVNGDNLPDILVGAPLYSKNNYFESGAVYLYLNKGNLGFSEAQLLTSEYELSGRFGTAIGKIGDINLDGYNDIAIGAPFEDTGVVYIYLGSYKGISSKPYQKINGPVNGSTFGHAISKGLDIDQNLFNDILVGAPLMGKAYLYKSYPVVTVNASFTPNKFELTKDDREIKLTACWSIVSRNLLKKEREMMVTFLADTLGGRATWNENGLSKFEKNVSISSQLTCYELDVTLKFDISDIFKPLEFSFSYNLINQNMSTKQFCEDCVQIDSSKENFKEVNVLFATGCASSTCKPNLKLDIVQNDTPTWFILGSAKSLTLKYQISNSKEPAYLTVLTISLNGTTHVDFAIVPPNCKQTDLDLVCQLNNGNSIYQGELIEFTVSIDMKHAIGKNLTINAEISSSGSEVDDTDNFNIHYIQLVEQNEIEISGKANIKSIAMKKFNDATEFVHEMEVTNKGPSNMEEAILYVSIPTSLNKLKIINADSISLNISYRGANIEPQKISNDFSYNYQEIQNDRAIQLSCQKNNRKDSSCSNFKTVIRDFRPLSNEPIHVTITFKTTKKSLENAFSSENKNDLLITTFCAIDNLMEHSTVTLYSNYPSTTILAKSGISLWIIIVAVLVGLIIGTLILVGLFYVLRKYGFFRREKKEQLEQEKRLTQQGQEMQPLNIEATST